MRRLAAVAAFLGLFAALALSFSSAASAGASANTSSVTKSGRAGGSFAGLKVSVSQTTNLINQVVRLDWTGGAATQPAERFGVNYLQVMQCWGDDPAGPTRDQCEFGGKAAFDQRGGDFSATRQLNYSFSDPAESRDPKGGYLNGADVGPKGPDGKPNGASSFVGFRSVTAPDKPVFGNANEFFDSSTSNELPFARTRPNGSGTDFIEMLTDTEASGLGCGKLVNGKPRGCWLVVVPRNNKEVDGSTRTEDVSNQLQSSPLSQTNWNERIVFPLQFAPVGQVCPIGAAERRTVGVEPVDEAVVRWQPVLCANNGPVFGFSQVGDAVAHRQLNTTQPGLAFLSAPVPPESSPPGKSLTYAPVTLSGMTISFLVESQASRGAPQPVVDQNGQRITSLDLTPRLVAKLLTQSYQLGVDSDARYLKDNPLSMDVDPDFLALNPQFKDLALPNPLAEILVPISASATISELWTWIAADPDARAFMEGHPDQWGMKINPFYQGQTVPRDDIPKVDPYCHLYTTGPAPLCTLDRHPYAADMHEGARSASRGDTLSRSAWDPNATPPSYKKTPLQLSGRRAVLALADTATAARYGLAAARLRNTSGAFVAPTDASLLAGLAAMTTSPTTSAVLQATPDSRDPAAYPLPTLTYAATVPSALTPDEAKDYANLIRFAAGPGQNLGANPGDLPDGYVPLPAVYRMAAASAALAVQQRRNDTPPTTSLEAGAKAVGGALPGHGSSSGSFGSSPGDLGTTASGGTGAGSSSGAPSDGSAGTGSGAGAPSSTAAASPARPPTLADPPQPDATAVARSRTPGQAFGLIRYALPAALGLGLLASFGGPAISRFRRSRR